MFVILLNSYHIISFHIIKVTNCKLNRKDVRLPVQLQRAMATEAEAAREARAKVIAAEGEQKASKALKEAAEVISISPIAIQLRYLQTLTQIASEKNSTVFEINIQLNFKFIQLKSQLSFATKLVTVLGYSLVLGER